MRTLLIILIPCILLGGLLIGARKLTRFVDTGKPCVIGACPDRIYEGDTGKRFVYATGTPFTIILDALKNPARDMVCKPDGIAVPADATLIVDAPLAAATFVGVSKGSCTITSNTFTTTIEIQ